MCSWGSLLSSPGTSRNLYWASLDPPALYSTRLGPPPRYFVLLQTTRGAQRSPHLLPKCSQSGWLRARGQGLLCEAEEEEEEG